jgi:serine/threonine-protein kinase
MYQMLAGDLPYETPAPADLDRLRRGDLVPPLRSRNPSIPPAIEAIVMRALAGDVAQRYQRAEELLHDLLQARPTVVRRPAGVGAAAAGPPRRPASVPRTDGARTRTREIAVGRFCWHCRKPLPARGSRCPFCGETQ